MKQKILKELLDYCPNTGAFIWRPRPEVNSFDRGWNVKYAGTAAGCINGNGYMYIGILGRRYKAHRLAWMYVYGDWPKDNIDHINHVRTDNRITNIREATKQDNQKNQSLYKTNTSGVSGVSWDKSKGRWVSYIKADRATIRLGRHKQFFEAVCSRKSAENKYGFHPNHGMHRQPSCSGAV